MEKVLENMLDREKILELENSECRNPEQILGAHTKKEGLLIQAYVPDAKYLEVRLDGRSFEMEPADENGFFAVLLKNRKAPAPYLFYAEYPNGNTETFEDPYSCRFVSQFREEDLRQYREGIYYRSYEKMGAHPMTIDGVSGVNFAVWAPEAKRVSVVGDFNYWNGRRHQMRKLGDSGIYELFIPGLKPGTAYKYEVKTPKNEPMLKADPYAFYAELRPASASVIWEQKEFSWSDEPWMKMRVSGNPKEKPLSIYEVHLGSWLQKHVAVGTDGKDINGSQFYNYRELAEELASYVKQMGYTHVQLMPVMEHPLDASKGYQVIGYYAPTSRFGTPDDFKAFVNRLHEDGIGVILEWVPAHFPKDGHGLAAFDGTCVYEHEDPRKSSLKDWGTLRFNYGRPQVANFLISNALFWVNEYHVDGIHMSTMAPMLYLDYGKKFGEWAANMYGGNEDLDAVEFVKHLTSIFHRDGNGAILLAEESASFPRLTADYTEDGLKLDFKWNIGWTSDFLRYMRSDPKHRTQNYGDLTFSMLYAYSENFVLVFSHDDVAKGKGSMAAKMPGVSVAEKLADLKAAYGFMLGHPGKKLLFMGQDFGQMSEWNEAQNLEWDALQTPIHAQMKEFTKALNHIYREHPALYEADYVPEGFEWINCTDAENNVVAFIRRSFIKKETVVFVCNFSHEAKAGFRVGVPFEGTYREILNSDEARFGGSGLQNEGSIPAEPVECDHRMSSITVDLPASGVCAFLWETDDNAENDMEEAVQKDRSKRRRIRPLRAISIEVSSRVGQLINKKQRKRGGKNND